MVSSGIILLVRSLKQILKPGWFLAIVQHDETHQENNMAELAGLPTPRMNLSASDAPQALQKFKNLCEIYFSGPPKDKSKEEQVSYLLIWSGEEGIKLLSTWSLSADT